MTPDTVMIFAAGFGTRMMPLTADRPKPMVEVAGKMLIDHAIDLAHDVGIPNIIANTHYKPSELEAYLKRRKVRYIRETPDILDTGGGLRNAMDLVGHPVLWTMNPDVIWKGPNPLLTVLDHWKPEDMDALLLCLKSDQTIGRETAGDFDFDKDTNLTRGGALVYGGVQIVNCNRLLEIEETAFSLNVLWDRLAKEHRLHGCIYPGQWCDVGTPEGIGRAETLLGSNNVSGR